MQPSEELTLREAVEAATRRLELALAEAQRALPDPALPDTATGRAVDQDPGAGGGEPTQDEIAHRADVSRRRANAHRDALREASHTLTGMAEALERMVRSIPREYERAAGAAAARAEPYPPKRGRVVTGRMG